MWWFFWWMLLAFSETFTSYWLCSFWAELWGCNSGGPKVSGKHQGTWHSRLLKHTIKYWFSKQLQMLQFDFRDAVMINPGRDFNHTWDKCILPDIHKYKPMLYLLHVLLSVVVVKLELMFSNLKLLSPQLIWGSEKGWYSERKKNMRKAGHLEQCSKLILKKVWYHWSSSLTVEVLQYTFNW